MLGWDHKNGYSHGLRDLLHDVCFLCHYFTLNHVILLIFFSLRTLIHLWFTRFALALPFKVLDFVFLIIYFVLLLHFPLIRIKFVYVAEIQRVNEIGSETKLDICLVCGHFPLKKKIYQKQRLNKLKFGGGGARELSFLLNCICRLRERHTL